MAITNLFGYSQFDMKNLNDWSFGKGFTFRFQTAQVNDNVSSVDVSIGPPQKVGQKFQAQYLADSSKPTIFLCFFTEFPACRDIFVRNSFNGAVLINFFGPDAILFGGLANNQFNRCVTFTELTFRELNFIIFVQQFSFRE